MEGGNFVHVNIGDLMYSWELIGVGGTPPIEAMTWPPVTLEENFWVGKVEKFYQ
jgi:hypothetical protein